MQAYLERVRKAYQRALDREALFEGLASRCRSEDRRAKLRVLGRLDAESRALLGSILADDITPRLPTVDTRRRVRVLADRRWMEFVDALCRDLAPQVAGLEELERSAPVGDQKPLARVIAHLIALQSFVLLELAGRARESVRPALVLIAHRADPLPLGVAAG